MAASTWYGPGTAPMSMFSLASVANHEWGEDTPRCQSCNAVFTVVRRRHHCRKCGKCVCNGCSPNAIRLDGYTRRQRVCMPCLGGVSLEHTQQHSELQNEINTLRGQLVRLQSENG